MSATDAATSTPTEFATSADGTRIAFSRAGTGPVLVLVDGALCYRAFGPAKAFTDALADEFTVVTYDRRGRGESGGGLVEDADAEVADLAAVLDAVGPEACVLSFSSGGAIAYRAAAAGVPMRRLVAYETPFVGRSDRKGHRMDYVADLCAMHANGDNAKMVDYFMVRMVGGPAFLPVMFRLMGKNWRLLKSVAPTLLNDTVAMGGDFEVPVDVLARVGVPVLVAHGSKAGPPMVAAQERIAASVPGAAHRVLDKQMHNVAPSALRPHLIEFLKG